MVNEPDRPTDIAVDAMPPAIILVEPQLADNIGATARAMLNCGLLDLRLINPRDGWPNPDAVAMASGATAVLDRVRVFDDLPGAVADLHRVYATTARHRDMLKHELTPRAAAVEIHRQAATGARSGILFGRERIGLMNDEVSRCEAAIVAPLNPHHTSLNLAQAVLLIAWEWRAAIDETPERVFVQPDTRPATRAELSNFLRRFHDSLEANGFFRTEALRPSMWRKVESLILRAEPTELDVRLLHGVVAALEGRKRPPSRADD
ncbi:MAG: RNA methyltransferase [Acidobacteriota bacterium]